MAPPCRVFPASDLPHEIQLDQGRRRKMADGRKTIDLSACALFSMTQYDCQIDRPEINDSPVRCWPVQRWFRRCQDRKGSFMVETTKWEGTEAALSQQSYSQTQTQVMKPNTSGAGAGPVASKIRLDKDGGGGGDWVNDWQAQDQD